MKRKMIGSILTLCMLLGMPYTASAADGSGAPQLSRETSPGTLMAVLQQPDETERPQESIGRQGDVQESVEPQEPEVRQGQGESQEPDGSQEPQEPGEPGEPQEPEEPGEPQEPEEPGEPEEPEEPEYTLVPAPTTSKASSKSIRISWDSAEDDCVDAYYVMRRNTENNEGVGKWKTIAKVKSDKKAGGPKNSYTDELSSSEIQQYEYKICTLSEDKTIDTRKAAYREETDLFAALGTNIKVCIDPGHYESLNNNYDWGGEDGKYPYSEGEFTLKIGKALRKELKEGYGIDSYMTRTTERISLTWQGKTFVNAGLDQGNVSVRGRMAKKKDCDFFISLHTNSTSSQENIWSQPKSVNKVYIFVNQRAHRGTRWMRIANEIGSALTAYNRGIGIQTVGFTKRGKNGAALFTNLANDKSNGKGTVVYRRNSRGGDYYGVLRGSHEEGVAGILVEHAFHTTKAMRKQAQASSQLYKSWAKCDAYGIARGFGFVGDL